MFLPSSVRSELRGRDHLTMHFLACVMSSGEEEESRMKVLRWTLFGDPVEVSSGFVLTGNTLFDIGVEGRKRGE